MRNKGLTELFIVLLFLLVFIIGPFTLIIYTSNWSIFLNGYFVINYSLWVLLAIMMILFYRDSHLKIQWNNKKASQIISHRPYWIINFRYTILKNQEKIKKYGLGTIIITMVLFIIVAFVYQSTFGSIYQIAWILVLLVSIILFMLYLIRLTNSAHEPIYSFNKKGIEIIEWGFSERFVIDYSWIIMIYLNLVGTFPYSIIIYRPPDSKIVHIKNIRKEYLEDINKIINKIERRLLNDTSFNDEDAINNFIEQNYSGQEIVSY